MTDIVFAVGTTCNDEPAVFRRSVYLPREAAGRLLPLLTTWSPALADQLRAALAIVDASAVSELELAA